MPVQITLALFGFFRYISAYLLDHPVRYLVNRHFRKNSKNMATTAKKAALAAPTSTAVKKINVPPHLSPIIPRSRKAEPAAKKAVPAIAVPKVAKAIPAAAKKIAAPAALKPIKTAFTKTTLQAHLAQVAGVDAKTVKAVLGALDATILASMNKKGLGAFTLPGLVNIRAVAVAAKKKRRGVDPFTKVERDFPAKPATVRVSARVLKKLKTAAL